MSSLSVYCVFLWQGELPECFFIILQFEKEVFRLPHNLDFQLIQSTTFIANICVSHAFIIMDGMKRHTIYKKHFMEELITWTLSIIGIRIICFVE